MALNQQKRYSRQVKLDDFGELGQQKLSDSHVIIVGLGGLGCPAALYLAAGGVGHLSLVDHDTVDVTNLHRQVLYSESDIGSSKAQAGARRIKELSNHTSVTAFEEKFDSATFVGSPDSPPPTLILDCADNQIASRHANKYSLANSIPLVTASVYKGEGRLTAFTGVNGACYSCGVDAAEAPSCEMVGTLGPTPGALGTLQASFAMNIISRYQIPEFAQLNIINTATLEVTKFGLSKNPECDQCSASTKGGMRLDSSSPSRRENNMNIKQILPMDLKAGLDAGRNIQIVDVREPEEWEVGNLESLGAKHIPMGDVSDRVAELDPELETVIHCRSGGRSAKVVEALQEKGFSDIANLDGGIHRWIDEVDSSITKC